ncbi:hypothetical protein MP638_004023, partial [Amoeboaphelidium occidentale]
MITGLWMKQELRFVKHDLTEVDVVGVDPGRKDLFYSVLGEKKDVASLSVQQWCWLRGDYHFRKKQKKWLNERNEVRQADKSMLTSKVPTVAGFIDFARSCVARFNVAFGFYGAVRWRKLKWNLYIRRQKAYDFACKKLKFVKKLKNIVVAYGDGSFSGNSRGYAPVPTKQ